MGKTADRKRNAAVIKQALEMRKKLRSSRVKDNNDADTGIKHTTDYNPELESLFSAVKISDTGRVPPPFKPLSPFMTQHNHYRGTVALMRKSLKSVARQARHWSEWTTQYATRKLDITLEELDARPESAANRNAAASICAAMRDYGAIPFSMRFVDANNTPLVAVFADRIVLSDKSVDHKLEGMLFETSESREECRKALLAQEYATILNMTFATTHEYDLYKEGLKTNDSVKIYWDGLHNYLTEYWEVMTQMLASIVEPHPPQKDVRHRYSANDSSSRYRDYVGGRDLHHIFQSNYPPPAVNDKKSADRIIRTRMEMNQLDPVASAIHHGKRKRSASTSDVPGSLGSDDYILDEILDYAKDWSESKWMSSQGNFFDAHRQQLEEGVYEERDPVSDTDDGENEMDDNSYEVRSADTLEKPYDHAEQAGIVHLAHCWPGLGQTGDFAMLQPSADMLGGAAYKAVTTRKYIEATSYIHGFLTELVKVSFPDEYKQRKAEFLAGRWVKSKEKIEHLFLCEAIVWKLQVNVHRDRRDAGICIVVPTGQFEGGRMSLPDLDAILLHRRGNVLVFRSHALYHAVETWRTVGDINPLGLTPGRTSHTLFNTRFAAEKLSGKGPDWFLNTTGGMTPDVSHFPKRPRRDA